ncbi:MAG: hypothetical protein WBN78_12955, partial [Gammaproteobacteria bacterium]
FGLAGNALAQQAPQDPLEPVVLSFDDSTGSGQAAPTNVNGDDPRLCGPGNSPVDICGTVLEFDVDPPNELTGWVTANTEPDGSGYDQRFVWYDNAPANLGGIGASIVLGTPSSDDSASGQDEWIIVEYSERVVLEGFWINGDHQPLHPAAATYFVVDDDGQESGEVTVSCDSQGFCAVGEEVTGQQLAFSAATSGLPFYLAGVKTTLPVVIDTNDGVTCIQEPCQAFTQIQFPTAVGQFEQFPPFIVLDPRADANGRCLGANYRDQEFTVPTDDGPVTVTVPAYICGGPFMAFMDTRIANPLSNGSIEHTLPAGLPAANSSNYICSQMPMLQNIQEQTVFGYFSVDNSFIEGELTDLTTECINPPKGRTGNLSLIVAGGHLECGIEDSLADSAAALACLKDLQRFKLNNLIQELDNAWAAGAIGLGRYIVLRVESVGARIALNRNRCGRTSRRLGYFLYSLGRTTFNPTNDGVNYEGNLTARAENALFTNDVRYCSFTQ